MAGRTWVRSMTSWSVLLTFGILWYVSYPRTKSRQIHARSPDCPGFDGNSDFYGLGIRIGVYLQWFSSWVSNTLNPLAAASNHDANSVFVLAVLIALAVAIANEQIQPIEAYVMLLLSNGFIFTVLSFMGIRIYFYQPGTLSEFFTFFKSARKDEVRLESSQLLSSDKPQGVIDAILSFLEWTRAYKFTVSFKAGSRLKHPALSWAGVAGRSAVGSFIAALNIWLWWVPSFWETSSLSCHYSIYFFGERQLSHDVRTFFKAASIIIMVPIGYYFLIFCNLVVLGLQFVISTIHYHLVAAFMDRTMGPENELSDRQKRIRVFLLQLWQPDVAAQISRLSMDYLVDILLRKTASETSSAPELVQNRITPSAEHVHTVPQLTEVLKAFAGFYSRGTDANAELELSTSRAGAPSRFFCALTHIVTLAFMTCFIVFIELTITASGISGVHTIGTTGQLIPFVLGIMSFGMAVRELLMVYLRKMLPDWKDHAFTMDFSPYSQNALGVTKIDQSVGTSANPAQHMQALATDAPEPLKA